METKISALRAEIDLYRSIHSLEAFDSLGDSDLDRFRSSFSFPDRDSVRNALRLFLSKSEAERKVILDGLEKRADELHGQFGSGGDSDAAPALSGTVDGLCVKGTVRGAYLGKFSLTAVLRAAQASRLYYSAPRADGDASWKGSLSFDTGAGVTIAFRFFAATRQSVVKFRDELLSYVGPEEWSEKVTLADADAPSCAVTFPPALHEAVDSSHCLRWNDCDGGKGIRARLFLSSTADFEALATALGGENCGPLATLDFTRFGIDGARAAAIAEALRFNRTVTNVGLSGNDLGPESAVALAGALGVNKSKVRSFTISANKIGSKGAAALAEALRVNNNGSLKTFAIASNAIGPEGALALAEGIKSNSSVTDLNLVNNGIGSAGAVAVAEALMVNRGVKIVYLGDNMIGPEGAVALAETLKVNKTLTMIDLEECGIGSEDAVALADGIKFNGTLTAINLYGNEIESDGAVALAEALKSNRKLENVNLEGNQIGSQGAVALAEALKVNKTLRKLFIQRNELGSEDVVALAEALRVNTTLTLLGVHENEVATEGAVALADMLKANKTLTSISLSAEGVDPDGTVALADAIGVNSTLQRLDFEGDPLASIGESALRDAIEANPIVFVPLTPEQRIAFLSGHFQMEGGQRSPVQRLPLDVIKRILLGYKVAQGRRTHGAWGMQTEVAL